MKINLSLVWLSFLNCAFVKAGIMLWKAKGKLLVYSSSSKYCSAQGPLWASYLSVLSPSFFFLAQVDFPNWRESWNSRRRFEGGATNPIRTENALAPPRHMYYAYMYYYYHHRPSPEEKWVLAKRIGILLLARRGQIMGRMRRQAGDDIACLSKALC